MSFTHRPSSLCADRPRNCSSPNDGLCGEFDFILPDFCCRSFFLVFCFFVFFFGDFWLVLSAFFTH